MSYRNAIARLRQVGKQQSKGKFNLSKEIEIVIKKHELVIVKMVRAQLASGIDADKKKVRIGKSLKYKASTIRRKKSMKGLASVTTHITNYMSGYFYNYMYVSAKGSAFEVKSHVDYFGAIISRSGKRIMDLTNENRIYFVENILNPEILKRYKQFYGI